MESPSTSPSSRIPRILTPYGRERQQQQEQFARITGIQTLGCGVGLHLSTDPNAVVFAWRHIGDQDELIALFVQFNLGTKVDIEQCVFAAVHAYIVQTLDTVPRSLHDIIWRRVQNTPLSPNEQAQYEHFLWHILYTRPPIWEDEAHTREHTFLHYAQRILL